MDLLVCNLKKTLEGALYKVDSNVWGSTHSVVIFQRYFKDTHCKSNYFFPQDDI